MQPIDKIRPSASERSRELALADKILHRIREISGREGMLVGSIAKNTCLRDGKDLDIFIFFDKATPREQLEREGLEIGKRIAGSFHAEWETHYAEHPYTCTIIDGYDVDLVPCYKLEPGERIVSAVDRSPLHTHYINRHLKAPDEVRLLKHFAKRAGVYGADMRAQGFSGYLCELLVLRYGSFIETLRAATSWTPGLIIDLEGANTGKEPAAVRKKFEDPPIIIIDPVDEARNAAAAVSEKRFCELILNARHFMATGKIAEPAGTSVKARQRMIYVAEWRIKKDIAEIVWSQLQRLEGTVVKLLDGADFKVLDSAVWTDAETKAQLLVEMEVWELLPVDKHWGPRVYDREHADKFIQKYGRVEVEGCRLAAEKLREFTDAKKMLDALLAQHAPSHLKCGHRFVPSAKTAVLEEYETRFRKLA